MTARSRGDARRYRRRILTIGIIALGLTYVIGARWYLDSVESDLERRVPDELADLGFIGISALFDGQDGTLSCTDPLADPEAARQAAYDVWGVRAIELDRSCRVRGETDAADSTVGSTTTPSDGSVDEPTSTTAPPSEPAFDTVSDALTGSPQLSLFTVLVQEAGLTPELADPGADDVTVFAPSDSAFEMLSADVLAELRSDPDALRTVLMHHMADGRLLHADFTSGPLAMLDGTDVELDAEAASIGGASIDPSDLEAANGVVHVIDEVLVPDRLDVSEVPAAASVEVSVEGGAVTLTGIVATEAVRATLRNAAAGDGVAVTDELTVDDTTGLDAATAADLSVLVTAMRTHLVEGEAGFDGESLYLSGTYASPEARDAVLAAAAGVGVTADLVELPDTSAEDAAALEAELNEYVAEHPILFEPGSSLITDSSAEVLDQLADLITRYPGVTVTVQGHTDSDGDPDGNLSLSQSRAFAVQQALIERGVPAATIGWEGFGSEQPILVDGVEDKAASRRVEFEVEAGS